MKKKFYFCMVMIIAICMCACGKKNAVTDIESGHDETFRLVKNTMDKEGQKMFQVYEQACGKIIINLKNKLVNYVRRNGGSNPLGECFLAIKKELCDADCHTP